MTWATVTLTWWQAGLYLGLTFLCGYTVGAIHRLRALMKAIQHEFEEAVRKTETLMTATADVHRMLTVVAGQFEDRAKRFEEFEAVIVDNAKEARDRTTQTTQFVPHKNRPKSLPPVTTPGHLSGSLPVRKKKI